MPFIDNSSIARRQSTFIDVIDRFLLSPDRALDVPVQMTRRQALAIYVVPQMMMLGRLYTNEDY